MATSDRSDESDESDGSGRLGSSEKWLPRNGWGAATAPHGFFRRQSISRKIPVPTTGGETKIADLAVAACNPAARPSIYQLGPLLRRPEWNSEKGSLLLDPCQTGEVVTILQPSLLKDLSTEGSDFLRWAWAALGWHVECRPDGSSWLHLPPMLQAEFGDRIPIRTGEAAAGETDEALLIATLQSLRQLGDAVHAAPACQPTSVRQLTPHLFEAYTVEGGRVRLGGCTLDDFPLIRMTRPGRSGVGGPSWRLVHWYTTPDGQAVDPQLVQSLHVDHLVPLARPPRLLPGQLNSWLSAARRQSPPDEGHDPLEPPLMTLIWCKHLHCKLIFEIGEARGDLAFSTWAQWLIDGQVSPPPFRCPRSHRESYRVVATDDGQVTVPEAVAVCEHTGRRVLESGLTVCEITQRRVLAELVQTCPVSGQRVLVSEMVTCAVCAQAVSPQAAIGGSCHACRSLKTVHHDDAVMARLLGEHPALEQWSRWRMAETQSAYILSGSSLFRRLLVVLDKESLDPIRLAESSFLSRRWSPIPRQQWRHYLD
jgi:hypothetical protein